MNIGNETIRPNMKLANKRIELIEAGYLPTGTDVSAEHENGFRMFENWKTKNDDSIMIMIDFANNGTVENVDWIKARTL